MKLNVQGHLKCLLWHLASLQWAEHKFNYGITGDDARSGHLSTSKPDENIEAVKKMILDNCRITLREVTDDVGISFGSCQVNFMDILDMKRVAARIVPKLQNFEQKQRRIDITQEMLKTFNDDPVLLKKIITGYDIETKAQSSQCMGPEDQDRQKARQVRWNVKVFLTVFFDCNGVHHEFWPQGHTVKKEY